MKPSVRFLLVVLCALCLTGPVWGQASIGNIQFGQADWYDVDSTGGGILEQYSLWGRMDFDVTGDATSVYYLNVVGQYGSNTPWLVQNLPLFPQTTVSGTLGLCVDIDLTDFGLTEGTALGSFGFAYELTTTPLALAPSFSSFTQQTPQTLVYRAQTEDGQLVDRGPSFGRPAGIKAQGSDSAVKNGEVIHKGVPRVIEDKSQCMPGAFARSLAWLNQEWKLGYEKSAQDIYKEIKEQIGIEQKLPREERIQKKNVYAKKISPSIVTKVLDVRDILNPIEGVPEDSTTDLLEWLKREIKTEDIELAYTIFGNGRDKDPTGAHIVTITGIYEQGGKTYLYYRDNEVQDGKGGDETIKGNPGGYKVAELGKVDGKYWFRNDLRLVSYAVSESVIPEPVFFQLGALAGLGGLGMLRMRRRG